MKTVILTRAKLLRMYDVLANPQTSFGVAHRKFLYALIKNQQVLETEVKTYNKIRDTLDEQRIDLLKSLCEVDENKEPILVQDTVDPSRWDYKLTPENREKFNVEYQALVDATGANDLLQEELEIEFYPIKFDTVPETLSMLQMQMLEPLLEIEEDGPQLP